MQEPVSAGPSVRPATSIASSPGFPDLLSALDDAAEHKLTAALRRASTEADAARRAAATVTAVQETLDDAELALRAHVPAAERETVACKAGCGHCCRLRVEVTASEVLRVVDWLRENRTAEQLEVLRARAAERDAERQQFTGFERYRARVACPLLEEESCSVYPARPLPCRAWTSYDVSICQRERFDPESNEAVPSCSGQYQVFTVIGEGLRRGLRNVGLSDETVELTGGLHVALTHADATQRWLAGEDLFADCRVGPRRG